MRGNSSTSNKPADQFAAQQAQARDQQGIQQQQFGDQFGAAQAGRRDQQAIQQQQFGDQFGAQQGRYADQQAIQQGQFGDQFSAGQHQFANQFGAQQQQFGDQFAANQGSAADQFGAQQNQFGDQFAAGQSRFADQFGAQQQQQGFANRMQNQNLLGQNDRFTAQQQANQFNEDMRRRGISNQEMMQQRQDPYNQLSQLLGMAGQVGNPSFGPTQQFGPMAPNFMGQANQHFQQQQQNRFNYGGLISGVGSAAIGQFSDRRIKRGIKKLGKFGKGISWYAFRYIGDVKKRIGFMADEVQKVLPQAVHDVNGVLAVDYGMVFDAAR